MASLKSGTYIDQSQFKKTDYTKVVLATLHYFANMKSIQEWNSLIADFTRLGQRGWLVHQHRHQKGPQTSRVHLKPDDKSIECIGSTSVNFRRLDVQGGELYVLEYVDPLIINIIAEMQGNNSVLDILRGPDKGVELHDAAHYKTLRIGELVPYLKERGLSKKAMTRDQIVDALLAWDLAERRHRQQSVSCYRVQLSVPARSKKCSGNQITEALEGECSNAEDERSCADSTMGKDDDNYDESDDDGKDTDDGNDTDDGKGTDDGKVTHVDVEHQSHERRSGKRSVKQQSGFIEQMSECNDDDEDEEGEEDNEYQYESGWDGKKAKELPKGAVVDDKDKPVYSDENGMTVATLFEVYKNVVARLRKLTLQCRESLGAPGCRSSDALNHIWKDMRDNMIEMLENDGSLEDPDIVATALNAISAFIRGL